MWPRWALAVLLAVLAPMPAASQTPVPPAPRATAPAPSGNADNGRRLYTQKACYYCHGTDGQGGGQYARIARVQRGQDNFIRYVRQPARMAAYSEKVVSDAELADIYAFLRGLPEPQPQALLNALKPRR